MNILLGLLLLALVTAALADLGQLRSLNQGISQLCRQQPQNRGLLRWHVQGYDYPHRLSRWVAGLAAMVALLGIAAPVSPVFPAMAGMICLAGIFMRREAHLRQRQLELTLCRITRADRRY